jgi:hypothetical protein
LSVRAIDGAVAARSFAGEVERPKCQRFAHFVTVLTVSTTKTQQSSGFARTHGSEGE